VSEESVTRRHAAKFIGAMALSLYTIDPLHGIAMSSSRGYGPDPDLSGRRIPWKTTMDRRQLTTLAAICDLVLPAEPPHPSGVALRVHEFVNEWISAPYPPMQADGMLVCATLLTLDEFSQESFGVPFDRAGLSRQVAAFDRAISDTKAVNSVRRLVELICNGYYSTREGHAAIGYCGNTPLERFPPVLPEVVAHFETSLAGLFAESSSPL